MKKTLSFIAALLLAVLACAQSRNSFNIKGQVLDKDNGEPIYMAVLTEEGTDTYAITDADGNFELRNIKAGTHDFTVQVLGYEKKTLHYNVRSDISGIKVQLNVESLALDEVVVTAKEGGELTSVSKISKQTIEHVQPSSLTDVMQLMPGSITANPSLTNVGALSIRDMGTNTANAAGTALIVDGASFSNDANMQVMSAGTNAAESDANAASTAGRGVDPRQVSTDNIESVEIIRGIPSVVYGDLTSGAVVVKTKAGVTPWEIRLKMDPKLKQVFAGKGFKLGDKAGVLNFDADYANAFNDVRTQSSAYHRVNFQAGYSNSFCNKSLTFNAKLRGNFSNATNKSDADLLLDEIIQERDRGVKLNINGKWIINKPWITNVEYLAAGGITDQLSREKVYHGSAGYTPATAQMEEGEALAFFTDPQYYSDVSIYGLPVDAQARITANQFGTYGKVKNKVILGAEWKMNGNAGTGKVFAADCPPTPGSASALRERSYKDIPFLHRMTAYLEDNVKVPIGSTLLEIQAGARFNGIIAQRINTSNFSAIEPRFNARYELFNDKAAHKEISIRAGWGKTYKMPSMIYLYPEDAYKDMVSYSYNDFDANNYGVSLVTTKKQETVNNDLKIQQSKNLEAGLDFEFKSVSGSLVFYKENLTNGYGFNTCYVPMAYRRYGYTWDASGAPSPSSLPSGAFPVYSQGKLTSGKGDEVPSIVDTTFMSYRRPVNDMINDKWGIEFTFDIAQIKAINTAINISGAYMNMKSTSAELTQKLYSGTVNNRTFPYVGIYGGSSTMSTGSIRERLSTNIRFVTHIPRIAMVVTLTAQMVFMDRTLNISEFGGNALPYFYDENGRRVSGKEALDDTEHTKMINPLYIMDRNGNISAFTPEMEKDPSYENLILTTNTANYYIRQSYPFYGMLNLRISKEIKKIATISFYANNFLNLRGRVTNSVTGYPADKNTPIYFGAEVKISIR